MNGAAVKDVVHRTTGENYRTAGVIIKQVEAELARRASAAAAAPSTSAAAARPANQSIYYPSSFGVFRYTLIAVFDGVYPLEHYGDERDDTDAEVQEWRAAGIDVFVDYLQYCRLRMQVDGKAAGRESMRAVRYALEFFSGAVSSDAAACAAAAAAVCAKLERCNVDVDGKNWFGLLLKQEDDVPSAHASAPLLWLHAWPQTAPLTPYPHPPPKPPSHHRDAGNHGALPGQRGRQGLRPLEEEQEWQLL